MNFLKLILLQLWVTLAFLVLFTQQAFSVTNVDRYVNTDCANNGDGTASSCAASAGAAGAYKTCQQAIDDITADNADFTSADINVTVHLKGSAADAGGDTSNSGCWITGLTLDSTRKLKLVVDQADRHDGKWNTGKYRIVNGYYHAPIRISEEWVTIEGFQLENNKTSASGGTGGNGIRIDVSGSTTGKIIIDSNLVRYTGDYTNQQVRGISDEQNETSGLTKVVKNNTFWDWQHVDMRCSASNDVFYAYNNTSYSNQTGEGIVIRATGTNCAFTAKNNLVNGSITNWDIDASGSGATWTHSNNLSEDTTSPDNTWDSQAVTFENEGSRDLHLASGDTAAKDQGTDLSAATEGMTTDIDGQTRSGTWDIGSDEYQSAGSGAAPFVTLKQMGIL